MKKILLIATIIMLVSCFGGKKYPDVGETCEITEECFAAISVDKLGELTRHCVAKDETAIYAMMSSGYVTTIIPAYRFKLLEVDFPNYKLLVEDLNGNQSEVWVSSQFIKEEK